MTFLYFDLFGRIYRQVPERHGGLFYNLALLCISVEDSKDKCIYSFIKFFRMEPSATLEYAPLPNGETYAYRDYGQSENVIVFVHGDEGSSFSFETIFPRFTNKFRVIALDLRGYGHSTNHTPALEADIFVEDLKLLFDHLKLKKFALLGWSMGGGVVMKFAARYPKYVSKLVLYHAIGAQGLPFYLSDEKDPSNKVRAKNIEKIKTIPQVLEVEKAIQEKDEAKVEKRLKEKFFNGRNQINPEALKGCVAETLKQKSYINSVQILNSYNITEESNGVSDGTGEIKKIQCPVLLIYGTDDAHIPVEEGKRTQSLLGEKAQLKVFEKCGHFAILHYPDEFVRLMDRFISK